MKDAPYHLVAKQNETTHLTNQVLVRLSNNQDPFTMLKGGQNYTATLETILGLLWWPTG